MSCRCSARRDTQSPTGGIELNLKLARRRWSWSVRTPGGISAVPGSPRRLRGVRLGRAPVTAAEGMRR